MLLCTPYLDLPTYLDYCEMCYYQNISTARNPVGYVMIDRSKQTSSKIKSGDVPIRLQYSIGIPRTATDVYFTCRVLGQVDTNICL